MDNSAVLSFWLISCEPDQTILEDIINRMAKQYDSVAFCPHVTLLTIPSAVALSHLVSPNVLPQDRSSIDWKKVLHPIMESFSPFSLGIEGVQSGSTFAKTIFAQLNATAKLLSLVDCIHQIVNPFPLASHQIDPHVSLLYQQLDERTKQGIVQTTKISQTSLHFDEIQVIQAPAQFETMQDISSLQRLYSQKMKQHILG